MIRYALFAAALIGVGSAAAQSTTYVAKDKGLSGSALVEYTGGGEFVYGESAKDSRQQAKPFLVGPVPRQSQTYFSAEEEQALLAFKNQKLAERVKKEVVVSRKRHVAKTKHYDWPKVVVQGDQVCVPELSSASATDWKDHLTCISVGQE
ncbi:MULTISPECIES: hypothetical protein [Herbaspirillum]|uniref:hypothetical protein n=1 Tax=Herbaspirillum TaxID=963 RepID=UPI000C097165|nr:MULTISPECIES: hypothetical protein [Herbaspirillum]MAF04677.1 hypothetical protein [Herbaspirillum sp.]UWE19362.1 hypothetical protein NY669_26670 [Herbaspirillum huttiense]